MYYPIMLDLESRKILIVGGGKIAARKARGLLKAGARPSILSPSFSQEIMDMEDQLDLIRDVYKSSYLKGVSLVFAATSDPEVNRQIVQDGEGLNILVNNVDDSSQSNFINMGTVDKEGLIISISTKGSYPALSKYIRQDLEERYRDLDAEYMDLLEDLRKLILSEHYERREELIPRAIGMTREELEKYYRELGGRL